jgi:hypothetical protein
MEWLGKHTITGETALLRPHPTNATLVMVQFSKFDHYHSHGWWAYARNRFEFEETK